MSHARLPGRGRYSGNGGPAADLSFGVTETAMVDDPTGCDCSAPARVTPTASSSAAARRAASTAIGLHAIEQSMIPAGTFVMGDTSGDRNPGDGELPLHHVSLPEFSIDVTTVTNEAFRTFVDATDYRTEAEEFGYSAVFHLAVTAPEEDVLGASPQTPWWRGVRGADWRRPGGAGSSIEGKDDHPVVHVSWNDALAYCAWACRRLPTEAEWECAARGGLVGTKYPWGDDAIDAEQWRANIFQGEFPTKNTVEDGWATTAPVRSFAPNGFGLWQPVGNVWEWCADRFDPDYYRHSPRHAPQGPEAGSTRILRGGSYLCHPSYCNRYRNSARSQNTPDSSMGNAGFRTVAA